MRYRVHGEWREAERIVLIGDKGDVVIVHEVADLIGPHGFDWIYDDGAHRVKAIDERTGKSHTRAKTWKGDYAWANAERMVRDIEAKVRYGS